MKWLLSFALRLALVLAVSTASAQWVSVAPAPVAHAQARAVTDANGDVHVLGGYVNGSESDQHLVYRPSTNTWTAAASVPFATRGAFAAATPDGKKIYYGGGVQNAFAVYDITTNAWTALASYPLAAAWEAGADVGNDGKLYVTGGQNVGLVVEAGLRIYDPTTDTWTTGTSMPGPRFLHRLVCGSNGRLYAIGGRNAGSGEPLSTVVAYDPTNDTWAEAAELPRAVVSFAAIASEGRTKISVIGGGTAYSNNAAPYYDSVYVYDVLTDTWTTSTHTLGTARRELSAARTGCDVFAIGGSNGTRLATNERNGSLWPCATTTLTATKTPISFGEPVTFTATVTSSAGITPTGTVLFTIDGASSAAVPLDANGQATLTTSALRAGTHTIQAAYGGDTHHEPDVGTAVLVVNPATTNLSLTSSTSSPVFGQPVTLTASITPIEGVAPTGSILFRRGVTVLATVALDATGSASFTTSALAAGTHDIVAQYFGDASYSAADANHQVTVGKASTSMSVVASASPSAAGASVTLTATITAVAPGAGTPTGSVTFRAGTTIFGQSAVSNDGTAKISTASLPVGDTEIEATYSGDDDFLPSSQRITHSVTETATTITVTPSKNPSVFGESVTFIIETSTPAAVPTGTITLSLGDTVLGTGVLDATGRTSITTSSLPVGTHTVVATYPGDGKSAGVDGIITQTVDKAPTTTTLAVAAASKVGDEVVLTADVTTSAPGTPTGKVTFSDGTTILATVDLVDGAARFSTKSLALGAHSLKAQYTGDDTYLASASTVVTHAVEAEEPAGGVTTPESPSPAAPAAEEASGCACHQAGAPTSSFHALALLAGAVLLGARRRRLS